MHRVDRRMLALFVAVALLGAVLLVVGVVRATGPSDDSDGPGTTCDFTEAGSERNATDGTRLVCTRYAPGAYRWERVP